MYYSTIYCRSASPQCCSCPCLLGLAKHGGGQSTLPCASSDSIAQIASPDTATNPWSARKINGHPPLSNSRGIRIKHQLARTNPGKSPRLYSAPA